VRNTTYPPLKLSPQVSRTQGRTLRRSGAEYGSIAFKLFEHTSSAGFPDVWAGFIFFGLISYRKTLTPKLDATKAASLPASPDPTNVILFKAPILRQIQYLLKNLNLVVLSPQEIRETFR
jgi:hypothetical protein